MEKITLLILLLLFISCGNNKEEQMLYDYQQNNAKALNFDLKDLDFKIQNIEKVSDITGADSSKILKHKFASLWVKNPNETLVDTLSFKFVKNLLTERITQQDTLAKLYQQAVITAIKIDDYSYELESKRNRDKAIDDMYDLKENLQEIEAIEEKYNDFSNRTDEILSTKYRAKYSMNNPMLSNTKQTFEKVYYTDPTQTKFILEEETL